MNQASPLQDFATQDAPVLHEPMLQEEEVAEPSVRIEDAPPEFRVRPLSQENQARLAMLGNPVNQENLAVDMSEPLLAEIGGDVIDELAIDEESRIEWLEDCERGLELALQKVKKKNTPWPGASNVIYPLVTDAAGQFAARAYPAIVQNRSVAKGVVIGDDSGTPKIDPMGQPVIDPQTQQPVWESAPGAKSARATRIGEHMSYQLLEEMPEWESETDTLLNVLSIVGCEFRKTYFDAHFGRPASVRVSAKKVIVNYWARSLETAARISEEFELYPYEIRERVATGRYLPREYSATSGGSVDDPARPHIFIEQYRRIDLDGDGYPEPYIVTVHRESRYVARIVANWENYRIGQDGIVNQIEAVQYYTKYDFLPNIEGGFYGHGWSRLLRSLSDTINSTLNMIMDAGTQQNMGGGFIGKGLSMHSGSMRFAPGEYKMVNAPGSSVRENVVPLVHQGPSPALMNLLTMLIAAGKDIAAIKDVLGGELKAQTMSPTVFTALVEQGLKVFTSIYKRVHRSLKVELKKLHRINRVYDVKRTYQIGEELRRVSQDDYALGGGVEPVSDPSQVVDAQKMARTQVLGEFKDDPMMDGLEIRRRMLEAANIEKPDKILSGKPAPNPQLAIQAGQLEIQRMVAKAQALSFMSQAIKNLADADATVAAPFNQWMVEQIKGLQNVIEQGSAGANSSDQQPSPDGLAPAPSDQGGAPISAGLAG